MYSINALPKQMFREGDTVFIDGRDPQAQPPLTVKRINLWDSPQRGKRLRFLSHGTRVQVIRTALYEKDGRWYYRVRYRMKAGWLPGSFLSGEQPDVLGDLV
jgi:hypothetical protein